MEIAYQDLDHEQTPLGRLELRRFVTDAGESGYELLIDGAFLMASHGSHSERLMARLAHQRLAGADRDLEVLLGGLGAGHTLRAVLDLPRVSRVVVAEIGRKVEGWNRRFFAPYNGGAVDDLRVEVVVDDVARVLRRHPAAFDLVLLDVDNGPGWLAAPGNAGLYRSTGLADCRRSLRPGGVLAFWSPQPNPVFEATLAAEIEAFEREHTDAFGRTEGEPGSVIYLVRA